MSSIVDDYSAIAAAMKPVRPEEPVPICPNCKGGGWECYGLGFGDPHFRVCEACGNPEDLPCP